MGETMRPIRVLIGILGLDQHEVGAVAVARMLRDAGMEVVYLGRFNLPGGIAKAAVEEGADVVGLSCHSWEYLHYLDPLLAALRERPRAEPEPRNWRGPYLRRDVPLDPWDRPYVYESPGEHNPDSFDLFSYGQDGQPGGEGEDEDVTNW